MSFKELGRKSLMVLVREETKGDFFQGSLSLSSIPSLLSSVCVYGGGDEKKYESGYRNGVMKGGYIVESSFRLKSNS